MHIRVVGDWTTAFTKTLGCNFDQKSEKGGAEGAVVVTPPLNKTLPRVMVDGWVPASGKRGKG